MFDLGSYLPTVNMQALEDERALRSRSVRIVAEMCVSVKDPTIHRTQRVLSACRCICDFFPSNQSVVLLENAVVGKRLLSMEIENETPVSQVITCPRCREFLQSRVAAGRGYDPLFQSQWKTWSEHTPHEFYPSRVILRRCLVFKPNLPRIYGEGMAPHMYFYKPATNLNVVHIGQSSDPHRNRDCMQTSRKCQGWVTGLNLLRRHAPVDWDDPGEPLEKKHLSDVDIVNQAQVVDEAYVRTYVSYIVWTASQSIFNEFSSGLGSNQGNGIWIGHGSGEALVPEGPDCCYCTEDAVGHCRVSKGKQRSGSPESAADELLKDQ